MNFTRSRDRRPLLSVGRHGHWASAFKWALPNPVYFGDNELLYYAGRNFNHNLVRLVVAAAAAAAAAAALAPDLSLNPIQVCCLN